MEKTHYDLVVLGGGSAGYAAARSAHGYGKRVAVVDGSSELGGLCILRGCMPSKTLIYSAEVLHLARQAEKFGLNIPEARVDMPALHQRKLRTIAEFAEYRQGQLQDGRFDLLQQFGKFLDAHTLELNDGRHLRADRFLLSTGSTVNFPAVAGLDLPGIWTSDEVLELDELPESVIVLGGGVVACELAQFLLRVGVKVTQIQRSPRVLKEVSAEAAEVVMAAFRQEGMELFTDTRLDRVEATEAGFAVAFEHQGQMVRREARHVFNALGRKPNTGSLNLEGIGVDLRRSGHVQVNEFQQSSQPHIYAAGDVAGPHEIVHVAIMQGELAAAHAFGQPARPVDYRSLVSVVFTDPQVAHTGLTEAEMKRQGLDFVVADYPFDDHGKSILMEAKHGYVKCWAERGSGRLLAAECVGKDASELIHAMAVATQLQANVQDLLRVHWYHPTLAEIWSYPLEDCAEEAGLW